MSMPELEMCDDQLYSINCAERIRNHSVGHTFSENLLHSWKRSAHNSNKIVK